MSRREAGDSTDEIRSREVIRNGSEEEGREEEGRQEEGRQEEEVIRLRTWHVHRGLVGDAGQSPLVEAPGETGTGGSALGLAVFLQ